MMKLLRAYFLPSAFILTVFFSCHFAEAQGQGFEFPDLNHPGAGTTGDNPASDMGGPQGIKNDPFHGTGLNDLENKKPENAEDLESDKATLVGMQLYEPKDLVLTGIISKGSQRLAMLEDANKKGHTIKEGDLIGRRGEVTKIEQDRVIITETATARSTGVIRKNTITMLMNTQGEF